jgi:hypothetical protein
MVAGMSIDVFGDPRTDPPARHHGRADLLRQRIDGAVGQ